MKRVLFIHNHYRTSAPSGEDAVAENERKLLEENGVDVISYEKYNDDIDDSTIRKKFRLGFDYAWSRSAYAEVKRLLGQAKHRPEIAHIHSLHPQISPSIYAACQEMCIPVVHTLHNYRYICPGALLQRDGLPCEDCVGSWPFPAIWHRCYRGSFAATGSLVWMICYNRWRGTFSNLVNRYIALTEFAASRLVAGGLPANRIEIKPNFLQNVSYLSKERKRYAVFIGRLSVEKGIKTLLNAWRTVKGLPLKILGDGPLRQELETEARKQMLNVEFMGTLPRAKVLSVIGEALFQIVPSECYEGFPMVILEAYACGTPVLASRIGSLSEIVHDGETGLHFEAGSTTELAKKVVLLADNPDFASKMGQKARAIFEQKYTSEQNFKLLMGIYGRARNDFAQRRSV